MTDAIATTVLCGFLGSGKTTRINALIRGGGLRDALFLVNDFGSIAIDAELIQAEDDRVLRLNNGCACCGVAGNLSAQLSEIRRWAQRPRRLIFEASGIARPQPLRELFGAAEGYAVEEVESLVDAGALHRHLADTAVADIVEDQLRQVDSLRVNRLHGLAAPERDEVLALMAAWNPRARLVIDAHAEPVRERVPVSAGSAETGPVISHSISFDSPVDLDRLERLLSEAAPALLRAKGLVQADVPGMARYLVQFAGGRVSRVATAAGRSSSLVLIGHRGERLSRLVEQLAPR